MDNLLLMSFYLSVWFFRHPRQNKQTALEFALWELRTPSNGLSTVFLVFTWVWLLCPHLYKWTTPRGKTKQCLKRLKTPYVTTGAGSGERSTWTLSLRAFSHLQFKSADQFVKLQVFLVGWFLFTQRKLSKVNQNVSLHTTWERSSPVIGQICLRREQQK